MTSQLKFIRTEKGLLGSIYQNQKGKSKRRGHNPPEYSLEEFREWACNKEDFITIYDKWVESFYMKPLRPSADRIDDNKGYSLDNIKIVTWQENDEKERAKKRKPILRINEDGSTCEFESALQAFRATGISFSSIREVCRGKRKSAGGYVWKEKTKTQGN